MTYFPSIEVSSARIGFTTLFGMGRGCPYRYNHQSSITKLVIILESPKSRLLAAEIFNKLSG